MGKKSLNCLSKNLVKIVNLDNLKASIQQFVFESWRGARQVETPSLLYRVDFEEHFRFINGETSMLLQSIKQ